MKALGIDIGTTSICAVVIDCETGKLIEAETLSNASLIPPSHGSEYERLQSPNAILDTVRALKPFNSQVSAIGITGQMHGMLYLNNKGEPVSPLYTWQDGRGAQPYKNGVTYADYITRETGMRAASGYGLVTHFYNVKNGLVPENASVLCTIGDYIAASVCGGGRPVIHPTNAHSIGLYNIQAGFDKEALERLGIDPFVLPQISGDGECIGQSDNGARVYAAIGDNQASVLGAAGVGRRVVINIGTGSQVSVITNKFKEEYGENIEVRPYFGGNVLIAGSALMGGDAYALLERFFTRTAEMLGIPIESAYKKMDEWLLSNPAADSGLKVDTRFKGTRANPCARGGVYGIGAYNFTPEGLIRGFLEGIAEELWLLYAQMPDTECAYITGAGNGLRKNKHLLSIFENKFGKKVKIPPYKEEAAYGAALFAAGKYA